jgi:hypothetical protein
MLYPEPLGSGRIVSNCLVTAHRGGLEVVEDACLLFDDLH